jgi:hypothetical protein
MNELSQAYLRELFDYDGATGELIWRVSRGKAKAGTVAGRLNSNGYHQIWANGHFYQRSRLVILYVDGVLLRPDQEVDHLNRIRHDDRRTNLNPRARSKRKT